MSANLQATAPANIGLSKGKVRKSAKADAAIIRNAIPYGQAIAAFHAGFRIDPASDDICETAGAPWERRAKAALKELAKGPATSAEALAAKASIVPTIVNEY
jgi:hypothetical protein